MIGALAILSAVRAGMSWRRIGAEPVGVLSVPATPVTTNQCITSTIRARDWRPSDHAPVEHAMALLEWLQGEHGRCGEWYADDLLEAHQEMCMELGWSVRNWTAVGREFNKLSGGKQYVIREGRRVRAYKVPERAATTHVAAFRAPKLARAA